jgi:ATP-dependent helicase/nuclease subunit A
LLVHTVLEQLDFAKQEASAPLVQLYAPQFLPSGAAEIALAVDMLARFGGSGLAADLASARQVFRELPFSLRWPLDAAPDEAVLIEGIIDCLYEDARGEWRLLDFKTNHVAAANVPATARRYEPQLYLYSMAIAASLGQPLASATLCFLDPGVTHACEWDGEQKRLLAESISAAIQAIRFPKP